MFNRSPASPTCSLSLGCGLIIVRWSLVAIPDYDLSDIVVEVPELACDGDLPLLSAGGCGRRAEVMDISGASLEAVA
jgi:hypothetical protein